MTTGCQSHPTRIDKFFTRANIIWAIAFCVMSLIFIAGRQLVTREEADRTFVRQDVYQRDYHNTTKQLDNIELKIDKVAEAVNARP